MAIGTHDFSNQNSEEIQEIISAQPPFVLRWGMITMVLLVFFGVGLAILLKYPTVILSTIKITNVRVPIPILSRSKGKIVKILVSNRQFVKKGTPIIYFECTADHVDVLSLKEEIIHLKKSLEENKFYESPLLTNPVSINFGELQNNFQKFQMNFLNYISTINDGFLLKKKKLIINDLQINQEKREQLFKQKEIQTTATALKEQELNIHRNFVEERVEGEMELKKYENNLLEQEYLIKQIEIAISTNYSNEINLKKELLEIEKAINEETFNFQLSINSLLVEIELWEKKYLLTSPEDGRVLFSSLLQENQEIGTDRELFYIASKTDSLLGEVLIPQYNLGKVKVGQDVLIKLNSFPFEEFGTISGKVGEVLDIPHNDSVFFSTILLNSKSFTDFKGKDKLKNGMTGTAEIIIEDTSLFQRFIRGVYKIKRF